MIGSLSILNKVFKGLGVKQVGMLAPFPRSQKILDANVTVRGSQVGLDAAEAFMEIRRIIR